MLHKAKLEISTLFIFILIPTLWLIFGYLYAQQRVQELKEHKYAQVAKEMNKELETLISEKSETILIIAMAIANNPQIKNILIGKSGKMQLDTFSKELKVHTSLKNIWFQVISSNGTSIYRSWTTKHGDNLTKARIDVAQMIQKPKVSSSISTGKFDLSFKSMVPLYDKSQFIGFIEVLAKFNSIATKMEDKKYDTVILVDKKYKKQLTRAFTKTFIENYYVANLNAKKDLLKFIKEKKVSSLINEHKNPIDMNSSKLISLFKLKDIYGNDMSYFLIFQDYKNIDISDIMNTKDKFFSFVLAIFFLILIIYYYLYARKYKRFVQSINVNLENEVIQKTKELHHIANHDDLTGLPNRLLFLDRLKQSIKHSQRQKTSMSLLFLDLDRFKEVNDTYGHQVGDALLQEVASKLRKSVREADTIARLGGDEVTIILEDVEDKAIIQIANNILSLMNQTIIIDGMKIFTTFSIGISRFPQDSSDPNTLLRNADTAMYKAKETGKNQYQFYDSRMTQKAIRNATIEQDLRLALENDELVPYFQIKMDGANEKIIGMEALVRWNHPTLGLVMPDTFIPIAESTGLIVQMDSLMIQNSIQQVKKFQEEGLNVGVLSINLSMRQLEKEGCSERLKNILLQYNYDPKDLEIEITETQIMQDPDMAIKTLQKIRNLGVNISVDDFGTGYSSLSHLKRLPINKLKIDRSFINELPHDKDDAAIVKAIISLAKNLDLDIIAEGVESKEQLDFLLDQGCSNIQGYYYSKPLPANKYKELLLKYQ